MSKWLLIWVCAAVVVQPQSLPTKTIQIAGRVVSLNGEPVRRATVRLQSAGQSAAALLANPASGNSSTTDDAGSFTFDNVAPGRYTLTAEKAGFLTQRYGARSEDSPGVELILAAGDERKGLDLRMIPQGILTGRITDAEGDPIAGVQVSVARYGYSNGRRQLIQTGGALSAAAGGGPQSVAGALALLTGGGSAGTSDDQGNFRIVGLAPGRYFVSANPQAASAFLGLMQGPTAGGSAPESKNVNTFYPNSLDAQGAAPVDLAAGGEIGGINIRIRKEKVYSIRGKVIDSATGNPAAGVMVSILSPDGSAEANPFAMIANMSRTGDDGSFEVRNLLPGRYILQGIGIPGLGAGAVPTLPTALSLSEIRSTAPVEVGITNANAVGAVLPLVNGLEIAGTVTVDGGKLADLLPAPPSGAQQNPVLPGLPVAGARSVRLSQAEGPTPSSRSGNFGEDGAFKITRVEAAKYFVTVTGLPPAAYVKSIKFAGRDITTSVLDITSGASGNLEVVLSAKAADFTGIVHNDKGEPLPGVPVTLWPKTADRSKSDGGIKSANTDQNGSFKISGLAPGDYYVAAWDDVPVQGLTQNPDFLARFAGDQSAVRLQENAHQTGEVKLTPRDRIVGEANKLP